MRCPYADPLCSAPMRLPYAITLPRADLADSPPAGGGVDVVVWGVWGRWGSMGGLYLV